MKLTLRSIRLFQVLLIIAAFFSLDLVTRKSEVLTVFLGFTLLAFVLELTAIYKYKAYSNE